MERDNSKGKEKLGESSIKNGQEQDFLPPPPPPPRSVSAEESEEIKRQKVSSLPSPPSSSSNLAPPGRRFGGGGGGGALCQAERCTADLSEAKRYHRRHKVCETHSKAPVVIVSGLHQRFCQQCSRFHELAEFDDSKRSCRRRLAGHNERRRKSSSDQAVTATAATTSGGGSGEGSGRCRQTDPPQDGRRIPLNGSSNPPPFKHFHIT